MSEIQGRPNIGKRFTSKVFIVTGAAQGIGRAASLSCAAEGANIIVVDRDEKELESTILEIENQGVACKSVIGDISNISTVEAMIDAASSTFGRLDGLVNNAATPGAVQPFHAGEVDEFDQIVSTNVLPVWRSMQLARSPMKKNGEGAIVNIASMAALRASRGNALYGMTKAAVTNLTMNAALEYAKDNIRVNAVCPGPIGTSMLRHMERSIGHRDEKSARDQIAESIPLRRCGTIWEVASVVTFLLSAEASFMTGVLLPVDGGISIKQ